MLRPILILLALAGVSSFITEPRSSPKNTKIDTPDSNHSSLDTQNSTSSTPYPRCLGYQWQCRGDGKCIDKSQRCDDYPHCSDASDEYNCNTCDESRFFRCHDQECISASFKCNGYKDCADGSDEIGCRIKEEDCPFNRIKCKSVDLCIPESWICDGSDDCGDHSDEEDCTTFKKCNEHQYQCSNGVCISKNFVCDGENDCPNGEDEESCGGKRCDSDDNLYQCEDGLCVSLDVLCNGAKDCSDGSDEGGDCSNECGGDCSHKCYRSPHGPLCSCPEGHQLSSDKNCSDVDECRFNVSMCDHFCVNSPGSYSCTCGEDYTLGADGKTCKNNDYGRGFLLVAMNMEIREIYLNEDRYEVIFAGNTLIQCVTYDPSEDKVYWSNSTAIFSKKRQAPDVPKLAVYKGIQKVESMAVDWYGRNLYIADSGVQQIMVCAIDGMECSVLIDNLPSPKTIQLDIRNKLMFWTDTSELVIERAGMDGSGRLAIVSNGLGNPNGLALDLPAKRVYWMDAAESRVEHVDYQGHDRKHLPDGAVSHPISMAVWENKIYWSDLDHEHVRSCLKLTGKDVHIILKGDTKNDFYGLTLYHSTLFPQGPNPCHKRHCSHMCLLSSRSSSGYMCDCPIDMGLSEDMHTCRDVSDAPYPFIADGNTTYKLSLAKIGHDSLHRMIETFNVKLIGDIAYDPNEDSIIVSDLAERKLVKVSLKDGIDRHIIDNVDAVAVAFDWLRNNVYWLDGEKGIVEVVPVFGLHRKVLEYHYYTPTDIAVAPFLGFFFVTDAGYLPFIARCGLDGTNCKRILVGKSLYKPVSIAVDRRQHIDKIYWCDRKAGTIESADIDGSNQVTLKNGLYKPVSLLLMGDDLLWALKGDKRIFSAAKDQEASESSSFSIGSPDYSGRVLRLAEAGWHVDHAITNIPCRQGNGGCNQLCLGNNNHSEVCACAIGYELAENGKRCYSLNCGRNFKSCNRTKSCIPVSWWCNGTPDCEDGEDEETCTQEHKPCSTDEFACSPGVCITNKWVCDGTNDCSDGVDEKLPRCENKTCPSHNFDCKNGQCIPDMWRCDGHNECDDGSDEEDCPNTCDGFRCKDGRCISDVWRCDGGNDCLDGSDEEECTDEAENRSSPLDDEMEVQRCTDNEINCGDQQHLCVPESKRCDGVNDCPSGNDEQDCCREDWFKCKTYHHCVSKLWICDGSSDCRDGSDESAEAGCHTSTTISSINAPSTTTEQDPEWGCGEGEFICRDGQCVKIYQMCNGLADCDDSSDEWPHLCNESCSKNNGGCQHTCRTFASGFYCSCHKGYHLAEDDFKCDDDKECDEESTCGQFCHELKGSYYCSCKEGFSLEPDQRTCKAIAGMEWAVLVGSRGVINVTSELKIVSEKPAPEGMVITSLDYDPSTNTFMYTEAVSSVGKLTMQELKDFGGKSKHVVQHCSNPAGVSVDFARRNFYFSEYFVNPESLETLDNAKITKRDQSSLEEIYTIIRLCSLESGNCTQIYRAFNIKVPSTKVSSEHQKFFYCTNHQYSENQAQVVMANLDGSAPTILRETKVVSCGALAIDEVKRRIYWTDLVLNNIQSVLWDGKSHRVIEDKVHHPIGLTLIGDFVMWYNSNGNRLVRCDKYWSICSMKRIDANETNKFDVGALLSVSPLPISDNVCEGQNCSHLCTVVHRNPKCLCYTSYQQSEEETTKCQKVDLCLGNPCSVGFCELLSPTRFVCRCPDNYSGLHCEVKLDALAPKTNAGTAIAVVVVLVLLVAGIIGLLWYKRQPFLIWKAKGRRANQTYRFSNPAFGVMPDTPIVTNSPAPSSCPSQSNNPPPHTMNNSQQNYHAYESPFSKVDEHQINTSLDSAVASGTDSTSVNIVPHQVDLKSPIPTPDYLRTNETSDWNLSPFNPLPVKTSQ